MPESRFAFALKLISAFIPILLLVACGGDEPVPLTNQSFSRQSLGATLSPMMCGEDTGIPCPSATDTPTPAYECHFEPPPGEECGPRKYEPTSTPTPAYECHFEPPPGEECGPNLSPSPTPTSIEWFLTETEEGEENKHGTMTAGWLPEDGGCSANPCMSAETHGEYTFQKEQWERAQTAAAEDRVVVDEAFDITEHWLGLGAATGVGAVVAGPTGAAIGAVVYVSLSVCGDTEESCKGYEPPIPDIPTTPSDVVENIAWRAARQAAHDTVDIAHGISLPEGVEPYSPYPIPPADVKIKDVTVSREYNVGEVEGNVVSAEDEGAPHGPYPEEFNATDLGIPCDTSFGSCVNADDDSFYIPHDPGQSLGDEDGFQLLPCQDDLSSRILIPDPNYFGDYVDEEVSPLDQYYQLVSSSWVTETVATSDEIALETNEVDVLLGEQISHPDATFVSFNPLIPPCKENMEAAQGILDQSMDDVHLYFSGPEFSLTLIAEIQGMLSDVPGYESLDNESWEESIDHFFQNIDSCSEYETYETQHSTIVNGTTISYGLEITIPNHDCLGLDLGIESEAE